MLLESLMNIKDIYKFALIFLFSVVLVGCQQMKNANKPFKHNTPLIKENIKKDGAAEIQKTLELGPKPAGADFAAARWKPPKLRQEEGPLRQEGLHPADKAQGPHSHEQVDQKLRKGKVDQ